MGKSVNKWAFLLIIVAFIWGTTFAVMKDLLEQVSLYNFLFWRFLLGGVFLAIWSGPRWKSLDPSRLRRGVFLGFLLFSGYLTQVLGLNWTTASQAGFITGLSVILVPLIALILGQESLRKKSLLGAVLAVIGLYLLNYVDRLYFGLGEFLVFLCAIFFALYIVFVSRFAPEADGPPFVALQILFMAFLMGILAIFFAPYKPWEISYLTGIQWVQIAYMGIGATALAYLWQHKAQQVISATFAALAFALEPVFATIFAFFYLGEVLPGASYFGGLLIVYGMFLAGREEKKVVGV